MSQTKHPSILTGAHTPASLKSKIEANGIQAALATSGITIAESKVGYRFRAPAGAGEWARSTPA